MVKLTNHVDPSFVSNYAFALDNDSKLMSVLLFNYSDRNKAVFVFNKDSEEGIKRAKPSTIQNFRKFLRQHEQPRSSSSDNAQQQPTYPICKLNILISRWDITSGNIHLQATTSGSVHVLVCE